MLLLIGIVAALIVVGALMGSRKHPYEERMRWLHAAAAILLEERLLRLTTKPRPRVAISVVESLGRTGFLWAYHLHGTCAPRREGNGVNRITISAQVTDPVELLAVLLHELIHALDDCKSVHGGHFKHVARAAGLIGPLSRTTPDFALAMYLQEVTQRLGPVPPRGA